MGQIVENEKQPKGDIRSGTIQGIGIVADALANQVTNQLT